MQVGGADAAFSGSRSFRTGAIRTVDRRGTDGATRGPAGAVPRRTENGGGAEGVGRSTRWSRAAAYQGSGRAPQIPLRATSGRLGRLPARAPEPNDPRRQR